MDPETQEELEQWKSDLTGEMEADRRGQTEDLKREVRDLFGADVEAHRLFIERMFKRLVTSVLVVLAVITGGAVFIIGNNLKGAVQVAVEAFTSKSKMIGEVSDSLAENDTFLKKLNIETIEGPRGPQGPSGPRGNQGVAGADGLVGDRGDPGPRGDRGVKGDVGEKGDKGERGRSGEKGEPGLVGISTDEFREKIDVFDKSESCHGGSYCTVDVTCLNNGVLLSGGANLIPWPGSGKYKIVRNYPSPKTSTWRVAAVFETGGRLTARALCLRLSDN